MKKRLNLNKIRKSLAEDMWGEILEEKEYMLGLYYYKCKFYDGFIIDDKNFTVCRELKGKVDPMTIIDVYKHGKERFIIERTNSQEKIPDKLTIKFSNNKYNERINVYAFTGVYMDILKYYHNSILRYIYDNKLEEKTLKYKSDQGYINSEKRDIMKYLALNSPDLVQKKDIKKAKTFLEKVMQEEVKTLKKKNKGINQGEVELIEDNIMQRIEVLCG